jgi:3-phosphoshikimate 1-carboxyvinyltransferase
VSHTEPLKLSKSPQIFSREALLPASKSISNRVLVMRALSGEDFPIDNLSNARDTQTMLRLLTEESQVKDVLDAGTTMRFLTAYYSVTGAHQVMTGTPRMCQRPIGLLVEALRQLGADIHYLGQEGFPPMELKGFRPSGVNSLEMPGHVSSQYISALMMVGPYLQDGLRLSLSGKIGSRPYLEMTRALMQYFGVASHWEGATVVIPAGRYYGKPFRVESDWSAASYWYSLVALAHEAEVTLTGLEDMSLQGDREIARLMEALGVKSHFTEGAVHLTKGPQQETLSIDFTHCPDLAQTVAVVCAVKGVKGFFTGLESLRIKETDRILALQNELAKLGARLLEPAEGHWELVPSSQVPGHISVSTYDDHRMAMAFAPLATRMEVEIEDPSVVNKSYPDYWKELEKAGVKGIE